MDDISSYNFTKLRRIMAAGSAAVAQVREQLLPACRAAGPVRAVSRQAGQGRMWCPLSAALARSRIPRPIRRQSRPCSATWRARHLTPRHSAAKISRYYGQGLLESLDYRVEAVDNAAQPNAADLKFSVKPNSWGPTYLRFGLRLEDDFTGNSSFNAATRLLLTDVGSIGAEWIWDAQLGGNPRLGTRIYLPFSVRRLWFMEPSALFQVRAVPQFDAAEQVGELRVRTVSFGGSIGRAVGFSGEVRAGLLREFASHACVSATPASRHSISRAARCSRVQVSTAWTALPSPGAAPQPPSSGAARWPTAPSSACPTRWPWMRAWRIPGAKIPPLSGLQPARCVTPKRPTSAASSRWADSSICRACPPNRSSSALRHREAGLLPQGGQRRRLPQCSDVCGRVIRSGQHLGATQ